MKRRYLLPSQRRKLQKTASGTIREAFPCSVSLNRTDDQIASDVKKDLQQQIEEEEPLGEDKKEWHDPDDSPLENYLRLVASNSENGFNHMVVQSVQDMLDRHQEAICTLRKARSSVLCDVNNVNIGRLETVTKQYIEDNDFLVEPVSGKHRPCVNGQKCLCMALAARYPDSVEEVNADSNGFVGREFLLPTQQERFQKEGRLPLYPRHCLVCNRALTAVIYTQKIHNGEEPDFMVMDHSYTRLDQPGEYRKNACLSIVLNNRKTTVCKHFVDFGANRYDYARRKGKRMLLESNIITKDFRTVPPPGEAGEGQLPSESSPPSGPSQT